MCANIVHMRMKLGTYVYIHIELLYTHVTESEICTSYMCARVHIKTLTSVIIRNIHVMPPHKITTHDCKINFHLLRFVCPIVL